DDPLARAAYAGAGREVPRRADGGLRQRLSRARLRHPGRSRRSVVRRVHDGRGLRPGRYARRADLGPLHARVRRRRRRALWSAGPGRLDPRLLWLGATVPRRDGAGAATAGGRGGGAPAHLASGREIWTAETGPARRGVLGRRRRVRPWAGGQ